MTDNNKVLTVTYGTFSCTLEGFDNSLSAVKEIAGYFRDLAADDRYFGAEPAQPDAEMLAQIVKAKGQHRVETSQYDSTVRLRAVHDNAAPQIHQSANAAQDRVAAFFAKSASSTVGARSPQDAEPHPGPKTQLPQSHAGKLERMRAVVSQHQYAPDHLEYEEDGETVSFTAFGAPSPKDAKRPDQTGMIAEAAQDIETALHADDANRISAEIHEGEDDVEAILRAIDADDPERAPQSSEAPVQGRLLKVNRVDLERALDAGEIQEFGDMNPDASGASREHEAYAAFETQPSATASPRGGITSLSAVDHTADEDLSRLMIEADHQMGKQDGQTRRSAFAHLRAAVSARSADQTIDRDTLIKADEVRAYRSDLADAVIPRNTATSQTDKNKSVEPQTTPLRLVAEQRVDQPLQGASAPRRMAAKLGEEIDLAEDTGFAAYAEQRGARALPAVIEAAAAYLYFVEGHKQFSRPQLMSHVDQVDVGDFSLEDGLRCIGKLLRAGKITKLQGGKFTASDKTGYRPDQRATG